MWALICEIIILCRAHIDQNFRCLLPNQPDQVTKWSDSQGCSHYNQKINIPIPSYLLKSIREALRQTLSKESNFGFDRSSALLITHELLLLTIHHLSSTNTLLKFILIRSLTAFGADGTKVTPMGLHHLVLSETGFGFKVVDILCQVIIHDIFIGEHLTKVVCWSCIKFIQWQKGICHSIKGLGFLPKEVDIKNSLRVWQIVFLQVIIKACLGRSEIGNACGYRDASSRHYDHIFE